MSGAPQPVSGAERVQWALDRVGDAMQAMRRAPYDRALVVAVTARWGEYEDARDAAARASRGQRMVQP